MFQEHRSERPSAPASHQSGRVILAGPPSCWGTMWLRRERFHVQVIRGDSPVCGPDGSPTFLLPVQPEYRQPGHLPPSGLPLGPEVDFQLPLTSDPVWVYHQEVFQNDYTALHLSKGFSGDLHCCRVPSATISPLGHSPKYLV